MINKLFPILALLIIFSCRKDKPTAASNTINVSKAGVYIINEGNFQTGNAKVSYYDYETDKVVEDLFQPANKVALGDVAQSMQLINSKFYLVVNNSGKVVVVNPASFKQEAVITGFASPRYILAVSNSKAYVTDLYANSLAVVNLSDNKITGHIPIHGWTEELHLAYGKVFVTNKLSNKIYIINTADDKLMDSITVGYASSAIVEDKLGKLWVMCDGSVAKQINASLFCINPINYQVEKNFQFNDAIAADKLSRLKMNAANDTLFWLRGSVYKMSINDLQIPINSFITKTTENFYSLGINPNNGEVLVGNAIDYVQRGIIYRYSQQGNKVGTFLASTVPVNYYFN
jgi:YVTN family beta-propeller protein